jgi:hypothetical protein
MNPFLYTACTALSAAVLLAGCSGEGHDTEAPDKPSRAAPRADHTAAAETAAQKAWSSMGKEQKDGMCTALVLFGREWVIGKFQKEDFTVTESTVATDYIIDQCGEV